MKLSLKYSSDFKKTHKPFLAVKQFTIAIKKFHKFYDFNSPKKFDNFWNRNSINVKRNSLRRLERRQGGREGVNPLGVVGERKTDFERERETDANFFLELVITLISK